MCKVSRSSFEERKKAKAREQEIIERKKEEDNALKDIMRKIMKKLHGVPGERGFKVYMWRDHGINAGRKLIRRLMNEMHIFANMPKKDAYKGMAKHDHPCTAPDNLVNQDFRIAPRKIICTDITYLYFGKLRTQIYLCVFRDAYTKEILGWAVKNLMTTELIKAAFDMMMEKHGKELKNTNVIIHSDQGSQYLSTSFKQILEDQEFLQSVSARANSQDNAPAESFFARLKTAILDILVLCHNYDQAVGMIDNYLNSYNTERYQYDLAGLTPYEFYLYCKTGIYPCNDYFGQKATRLRSLESIIREAFRKMEEKARRMRDIYRERSRAAQLLKKDPLQITIDDQKLLERVIYRYTKHRDKVDEEIKRLSDVLVQARQAQEFMESLTPEQRNEYCTVPSWQNEEKLQYIYGMGGLF
jgi:transposase InsO family protein